MASRDSLAVSAIIGARSAKKARIAVPSAPTRENPVDACRTLEIERGAQSTAKGHLICARSHDHGAVWLNIVPKAQTPGGVQTPQALEDEVYSIP